MRACGRGRRTLRKCRTHPTCGPVHMRHSEGHGHLSSPSTSISLAEPSIWFFPHDCALFFFRHYCLSHNTSISSFAGRISHSVFSGRAPRPMFLLGFLALSSRFIDHRAFNLLSSSSSIERFGLHHMQSLFVALADVIPFYVSTFKYASKIHHFCKSCANAGD